jgi:hypothetical protein
MPGASEPRGRYILPETLCKTPQLQEGIGHAGGLASARSHGGAREGVGRFRVSLTPWRAGAAAGRSLERFAKPLTETPSWRSARKRDPHLRVGGAPAGGVVARTVAQGSSDLRRGRSGKAMRWGTSEGQVPPAGPCGAWVRNRARCSLRLWGAARCRLRPGRGEARERRSREAGSTAAGGKASEG